MRLLMTSLISIFLCSTSFAITAINVKENRVLLRLDGQSVSPGDRIGARDSSGKARALLEVQQVRGDRAIAVVTRGRMDMSYSLSSLSARGGSRGGSTQQAQVPRASARGGKNKLGAMAGLAMNNMSVKDSAGTWNLAGTSFNLGGFYQLNLDGNISARVVGGYETFGAKVSAKGSNMNVDISYLGGEALVQYTFLKSRSFDAWAGGGLGFLFAIGKSANAINEDKISTNQTIVGALGVDYKLKNGFIPIQFDYLYYPSKGDVSTNQMIIRVGYGISF